MSNGFVVSFFRAIGQVLHDPAMHLSLSTPNFEETPIVVIKQGGHLKQQLVA
jgi:hypothetical protein